MTKAIRAWDTGHRHGPPPIIRVFATGAPIAPPAKQPLVKRHTIVTIT